MERATTWSVEILEADAGDIWPVKDNLPRHAL
jgi:hypothetical protein